MAATERTTTLQWARTAGIVAVIGALMGMVGDYCLLYAPDGGYLDGDYAFLRTIPNDRLLWGHYLGILAIPLEGAGLYLIYLGLRPMGQRIAMASVIAGLYILFAGVAYHAGVYPLADAVRMGSAQVEAFRPFNEPLGLGFAAVFFVLIAVLTVAIWRGKTAFPKHYAAYSPLFSYLAVTGLLFVVPSVGNLLAPMGFNLSMALFFVVLATTAPRWLPRAHA
jgi:hypothetical protein